MLVGANDGAIDMMQAPVEVPCGVGLLLQFRQDAVPDTGSSPPIETGGNGLPRTVPGGQITPRCSRTVQPQHTIDNAAVIRGRTATGSLLWWEQRMQPLPLLIGQISSVHTSIVPTLRSFENRP